MGKSNLEIAITALNQATSEIQGLTDKLKGAEQATKDHTKAVGENNDASGEMKKGLNEVVTSLTGFNLAEISVAGAVIAGVEFMKKSVETTQELGEATEKTMLLTGSSAEEASKLNAISKDLGVSQETLTKGLEAAIKRGYQPSIEGIRAMGTEWKNIKDPVAQAKYLMDNFGKSGVELKDIFEATGDQLDDLGKHAEQVGLIMGDKDVEAAKKLSIQTNELSDAWTGFMNRVGQKVIPVLSTVVEGLNDWTDTEAEVQKRLNELNPVVRDQAAMAEKYTGAIHKQIEAEKLNSQAVRDGKNASESYVGYNPALVNAASAATTGFKNQKDAAAQLKDEQNKLSSQMQDLTKTTIFNTLSAGLNADQQFLLAQQMGLISPVTLAGQYAMERLRKELDDGKITVQQYAAQARDLAGTIGNLNSKTVTITTIYRDIHQGEESGTGSGLYGGTGYYAPPGSGGQYMETGGKIVTRASGGPVGPGTYLVGENGPEFLKLNAGSNGSVTTNYNFNVSANYANQPERSLRNDIRLMQMMRHA